MWRLKKQKKSSRPIRPKFTEFFRKYSKKYQKFWNIRWVIEFQPVGHIVTCGSVVFHLWSGMWCDQIQLAGISNKFSFLDCSQVQLVVDLKTRIGIVVKRRDCDRYSLDFKTTHAILLCFWEKTLYGIFSC